jgi:hypothetical protein
MRDVYNVLDSDNDVTLASLNPLIRNLIFNLTATSHKCSAIYPNQYRKLLRAIARLRDRCPDIQRQAMLRGGPGNQEFSCVDTVNRWT